MELADKINEYYSNLKLIIKFKSDTTKEIDIILQKV